MCNNEIKFNSFLKYLHRLLQNLTGEPTNKHNEKLHSLYGGRFLVKQESETVINIYYVTLSENTQKNIEIGMNSHLENRVDKNITKNELEKLHDFIKTMLNEDKLTMMDDERLLRNFRRIGFQQRADFTKVLLKNRRIPRDKVAKLEP